MRFRLRRWQRIGFFFRRKTGFFDDGGNVSRRYLVGIKHHLRFFIGEVHPRFGDKVFFVQYFFNARSTGLAGHAFDLETDFLLHGFVLLNVVGLPEKSGAGFFR
ncbi:hypothetical protein A7Q02_02650 [Eikenella sp. NML97-A-109]|nr:hypothetical protein A7Q02_02650 [Eikenella sp. NML97-A-109]